MEEFSKSFCILIASHLCNNNRISYIQECLGSLTSQTIPIDIYLSISFKDEHIGNLFLENDEIKKFSNNVNILPREEKTAQMKHFLLLQEEFIKKKNYKWIMFCDDDDTYERTRVERIMTNIYYSELQCSQINSDHNKNNKIMGLYESTFGKDHREHRHEYWCYCVHYSMLENFYEKLKNNPDIIENKCCDVLFAEYLRRSREEYLFCRLDENLYNYRIDNNSDSITGFIKGNQAKFTRLNQPPSIMDLSFAEYAVNWDEYLGENIDVYLHDVFLRTIVGCEIDYILRAEFRADYAMLPYVNTDYVNKIKENHTYWRTMCDSLFDVKFA